MKSVFRSLRRTQAKSGKHKPQETVTNEQGNSGAGCVDDGDEDPQEVVVEETAPPSVATAATASSQFARGSSLGQRRLMKEFQQYSTNQSEYFTVELVDERLNDWNIKVFKFDPESRISHDMAKMGIPHILLNAAFPADYPIRPPFLHVVSPRIENGFVLRGGAICMELLTPKGWSSAYTIESIIMQFVSTVVKGKGKVSMWGKKKDYKKKDAEKTFREVVMLHEAKGWRTPPKWEG